MVKTYRKRPLEVEAIQFVGTKESAIEIADWVAKNWPEIDVAEYSYEEDYDYDCLEIETPRDDWEIEKNDWLIKGVDGSLYPVKNSTFIKTYEEVCSSSDGGVRW